MRPHRTMEDVMGTYYREAVAFARLAHAGQVDKAGIDYFSNHIGPVAKIVREELGGTIADAVVAYLHDVLEDTDATLQDVVELFGAKIAKDVLTLTREDGVPYWKYIEDIAEHGSATARMVKRADLMDHLNKRGAIPDSLAKRYTKSLEVLDERAQRDQEATV